MRLSRHAHTGRMRVLNFGSTSMRKLLRDTAPEYSGARAGVRGACDGGADCNRYAHALALSVYAVLGAPQQFDERIPKLVMRLKTLFPHLVKLPYNAQIFGTVSSMIALDISSSRQSTFYDSMKRAVGNQQPHSANHKRARDIVKQYYKNTKGFVKLEPTTFTSILDLISTDATTLEIYQKLEGHAEDDIWIKVDDAFDVIMSMLPHIFQDEGEASLQTPRQLQPQFLSPPSLVTLVQQPLTSHLREQHSSLEMANPYMPPPTAPGAHDAGIDYGENAADIAADNMAAHIAAEGDKEMLPALLTSHPLPAPDPALTQLQLPLPHEYVLGDSMTVNDIMQMIELPFVLAQAQGSTNTSFDPDSFQDPCTLYGEDGLLPVSGASVSEQRAAKRKHAELEDFDAFARRMDNAGF